MLYAQERKRETKIITASHHQHLPHFVANLLELSPLPSKLKRLNQTEVISALTSHSMLLANVTLNLCAYLQNGIHSHFFLGIPMEKKCVITESDDLTRVYYEVWMVLQRVHAKYQLVALKSD